MILPILSLSDRRPGRIVVAVAFLLALCSTRFCSAAEVSFGGNYSLQLPASWTAKPGKDKAIVGGTRGVNFSANAFPTKQSPEEIMENAIGLTEKKAGYKLIEKGSVKSSAGLTASLFRFQLEEGGPAFMGVNYYFRVGENDVVALVFGIASDTPKSIKSEIEAIFNSVKMVSAPAAEDSWLSKPAEKSQKPSKTSGGEDSDIAGRYVKGSDYMELKGDGTFTFQMRGDSGAGTYTRKGATITFDFSGDKDDAKLDKDGFVDAQGGHWVKKP
jgi:hypothetical protein